MWGECEHGTVPEPEEEDGPPRDWRDDGTYVSSSDSIVCTSCYVRIGMPLNPVVPHATPESPSHR